MTESHLRSIVKATSYRVLGSFGTFVIGYIITGDTQIAASISVIELFSKIGLFWVHERIWNQIKFGKHGT